MSNQITRSLTDFHELRNSLIKISNKKFPYFPEINNHIINDKFNKLRDSINEFLQIIMSKSELLNSIEFRLFTNLNQINSSISKNEYIHRFAISSKNKFDFERIIGVYKLLNKTVLVGSNIKVNNPSYTKFLFSHLTSKYKIKAGGKKKQK